MLGIIGGNGVAATNRLLTLIENKLVRSGAYRDCHHPEMIVWQATQAPSRSLYLEGRGKSFLPDYLEIGKKLKECGCDTLCMCCNTAHFFIKDLEDGIGLPFIDIIKETIGAIQCDIVQEKRIKVGIMCSDGCASHKLYDKYVDSKYIEIIYPDKLHQSIVTQGICSAKSENRYLDINDPQSPYFCFNKVASYLMNMCDVIVGGCTDINAVFYPGNRFGISKYIDSLDVLADVVVERFMSETK